MIKYTIVSLNLNSVQALMINRNLDNENVKLNKHFMIHELISKIQKSNSNFLYIFLKNV